MNGLVNIYKPIGMTPYEMVTLLKTRLGIETVKCGYAGRLDPMASGVLVLMIGDTCKQRDLYQGLSKTYDFNLILGISTDSYDLLGIITDQSDVSTYDIDNLDSQIREIVADIDNLSYPPYSSKTINGVPLHQITRTTGIDEIELPRFDFRYSSFDVISINQISSETITTDVIPIIQNIPGDFRQKQIVDQWKELPVAQLILINCRISVKSGTYIRSLAYEVGRRFGIPALASDITRLAVGGYKLDDSIHL